MRWKRFFIRIFGKKVGSVHGYSEAERLWGEAKSPWSLSLSGRGLQVVAHHLWQFGRAVYAELLVHVGATKHHVNVAC